MSNKGNYLSNEKVTNNKANMWKMFYVQCKVRPFSGVCKNSGSDLFRTVIDRLSQK